MALTSLESISEKLVTKRQSDLESILSISGSAVTTKNEYGVTIVDNTDIASSLVFKNLSKPKYDEVELIKAIDVDIKELKPATCVTSGWIFEETKYYIKTFSTYSLDEDGNIEFGEIVVIPKQWVIK